MNLKEAKGALNEIMEAMPKKKLMEFVGHFNELFLYLDQMSSPDLRFKKLVNRLKDEGAIPLDWQPEDEE